MATRRSKNPANVEAKSARICRAQVVSLRRRAERRGAVGGMGDLCAVERERGVERTVERMLDACGVPMCGVSSRSLGAV